VYPACDAVFHLLLRLLLDFRLALLADHVDGDVDQVTHHRLDIAADVTDLGELRCFDLDERRTGQAGEAACNLGFADAGRTDQDDVVRHDLLTEIIVHTLAPPPVAQRDRDRALRIVLSDDVLVQLTHDLPRRQLIVPLIGGPLRLRIATGDPLLHFHIDLPPGDDYSSSSTVIFLFV
jgi:hypothetical protein